MREAVNESRRKRKLLCYFSGLNMKQLRKGNRSNKPMLKQKLLTGKHNLFVFRKQCEESNKGGNNK